MQTKWHAEFWPNIDILKHSSYILNFFLRARLSAAAANRLRDQNPGITDLSDPNRPLKLAEKVSELYDNEWTNAIENLEAMNVPEEKGIRILLKIIQASFYP